MLALVTIIFAVGIVFVCNPCEDFGMFVSVWLYLLTGIHQRARFRLELQFLLECSSFFSYFLFLNMSCLAVCHSEAFKTAVPASSRLVSCWIRGAGCHSLKARFPSVQLHGPVLSTALCLCVLQRCFFVI